MTEYDPPEPFNAFYEVVTVGRKWHLIPDVKIYYISETRSVPLWSKFIFKGIGSRRNSVIS